MADLIRTLIVDDEPLVREGLCDVIGFIKDVEIVGECDNGLEAVQAIRRLAPDAVFLDIRMPGLNGFEVIESLKPEERPIIIFVTAYNEFAVGAFKINAADYLLKPFNEDNVRSAITRVRERLLIGQNLQTDRKINQLLRQQPRLQTVSNERHASGQTSEIASRFGLLGFANAIGECHSAAEKQQTASIEQSGKEGESGVGAKAREGGKCHSTVENLSDFERTLSSSPKAIRFALQLDSRFA